MNEGVEEIEILALSHCTGLAALAVAGLVAGLGIASTFRKAAPRSDDAQNVRSRSRQLGGPQG